MAADWEEAFRVWKEAGSFRQREPTIRAARRMLASDGRPDLTWFEENLSEPERREFVWEVFLNGPIPRKLVRPMLEAPALVRTEDFLQGPLRWAREAHLLPFLTEWLVNGDPEQQRRAATYRGSCALKPSARDDEARLAYQRAVIARFNSTEDERTSVAMTRQMMTFAPDPALEPDQSAARAKVLVRPERYGYARPSVMGRLWRTVKDRYRRWFGYKLKGLT